MMESGLSLTVLVDTTAPGDRDHAGGDGLSFLLETAGKKILFDTGLSGLLPANAGKMGIDLSDLDFLVLSQGHIDHTGGLPALIRHLAGQGGEAVACTPPHRPLPLLPAKRRSRQERRLTGR